MLDAGLVPRRGAQVRVSDYVLQRLASAGVTHAFTVYGGAISEMMDAFTRQSAIKYVTTIHEQAAGFAAEGYAKVSGLGLAIATSGPGGGNLVTAIQDCYYDSTPCIFITGQVTSQFIRPDNRVRQLGFQETPIVDIVRPITKYAKLVRYVDDVQSALEMAIYEARNGRPGPVLLDIPIDIQKAAFDVEAFRWDDARHNYPRFLADKFLFDLRKAKRPAILVGGGARGSELAIAGFAARHRIPIFRTWNALDIATDDMETYCGTIGTYGGPGRNFGIQGCDLLLSLGCRMSGRITGGLPKSFAKGAKKYIVDIDLAALKRDLQQVKADVNCLSSVADFMFCLKSVPVAFDDWLGQCREWLKYDPVKPEMVVDAGSSNDVHHYGFMRRLSELMPANAIVIYDTGGNAIMMGHCFRSKMGQRIFSSNGNTPMGFAMCGAIGAWYAAPHRPIVCIIGDGGFQMNIQELQTLVKHGINIKVFIINNHILGNTKSYQRVNGMKEVGCGPDGYSVPDFGAIARAYGLSYSRIERCDEVDSVINLGATICDVIHHDFCQYEPRVSRWDVGIEEAYPPLEREQEVA
jgi:acetolactate synthase I/II/III large subunit